MCVPRGSRRSCAGLEMLVHLAERIARITLQQEWGKYLSPLGPVIQGDSMVRYLGTLCQTVIIRVVFDLRAIRPQSPEFDPDRPNSVGGTDESSMQTTDRAGADPMEPRRHLVRSVKSRFPCTSGADRTNDSHNRPEPRGGVQIASVPGLRLERVADGVCQKHGRAQPPPEARLSSSKPSVAAISKARVTRSQEATVVRCMEKIERDLSANSLLCQTFMHQSGSMLLRL